MAFTMNGNNAVSDEKTLRKAKRKAIREQRRKKREEIRAARNKFKESKKEIKTYTDVDSAKDYLKDN